MTPAPGTPVPPRRLLLCGALIFWLAGYWFASGGWIHRILLCALVLPALLLDRRGLAPLVRRGSSWYAPLLALLAWQAATTTAATGSLLATGGIADGLAVLLLAVALHALADTPGARDALLLSLFAVAAAAMAGSLAVFYPLRGVEPWQLRLRDVWVYRDGLNPVLTGMLAGQALVAGWIASAGGGGRVRRAAVWLGLAVLAFALVATRARGPLVAAAAAGLVALWLLRRAAVPGLLASAAGAAAYLGIVAGGTGAPLSELFGRGLTGRLSIWRTYVGGLEGLDWLWGQGACAPLDRAVLGWHVHHPHSSPVAQLVQTGLVGAALLTGGALWVLAAGLRRPRAEGAPLALFAFGLVALAADCSLPLSLFTAPRVEPLLVLVPAVLLLHPPPAAPLRSDVFRHPR